ncbi:putative alpha-l-rhamnosidase protein-2 [Coleophoma cylindrospora]|uniref:Putative alpha-l-rhamnosidase protein-2 n=1 Tax=Coleophoma cylindrospora TaxID=1849047 RepID=A0A3D8QL90_9HELO|nr:putative alpha-l-rhamnosidase protein-2 [Coleophoma cylindrospora]
MKLIYDRHISRLIIALLPLGLVTAQNCWKNTTCTGPTDTAFPGVWESNIYSPSSRTVFPQKVLSKGGQVISSYTGKAHFVGNGSQQVFDFGKEVGGLITLEYTASGPGALGLAFTEAKNWIGEWSDSSSGASISSGWTGPPEGDGAIYANFTSAGKGIYVMPDRVLRGGFRYLTLFLISGANSTTSVDVSNISLSIGFQPTWANLRAYQGYFHSNDEELNKIWYSGAYTVQTNSVPVNTGRQIPVLKYGWANNGTLGSGDTIIVDGAKRDRAVWPGDMGIAVPSTFVSTGDLTSVKNALLVMYQYQNAVTGAFPEAGPPLLQLGSDTYHMWTMIGTYNYVLYTDDIAFLEQNWAKYLLAMKYIYGKVTYSSGLLNVTGIRDWARWQQGFNNSEAQMILYHTLQTGADLATWMGDTTNLTGLWNSRAASLRTAVNQYCWDGSYGAFKDNATATALHPQDANSMALLFNVIDSDEKAQSISSKLTNNWTPIGAVAPELPENISPFISSFEIQGHLAIGQTARALDLIRRSWGWYLNHPNGTQSTVIEGYLQNGTFGYRSSRGYAYDDSYISHSHGWSSGPTAALTTYVLGLSVTSPVGKTWKLAPQFGDLTSVEGGFVTSLGKFQAKWEITKLGYLLEFVVPVGTEGQLVLPYLSSGVVPKISLDGKVVHGGNVSLAASSALLTVAGGIHSVIVA